MKKLDMAGNRTFNIVLLSRPWEDDRSFFQLARET
jgi:hypothetical protein